MGEFYAHDSVRGGVWSCGVCFREWAKTTEPTVNTSNRPDAGHNTAIIATEPTDPVALAPRMPVQQLAKLLKVSAALSSSLDLPVVLQTSVESATEALGLDSGAIYTIEGETLRLGAATPPLPPGFPDELRLATMADHPHIMKAMETAAPLHVHDIRTEPLTPAESVAVVSRDLVTCVYIPLIANGIPEGVLILSSSEEASEFSEDHMNLTRTLANQIAMTVMNAQLYDRVVAAQNELSAAYDATIAGWSTALEMRDEGTAGHTNRVTDLTVKLAAKVGIPDSDLPHVRRGALLHDIGKMVVPDAILHKPSALDEDEWAIMRAHPDRAREFLANIEYLVPAVDIPYCHHERWDGTGYPRGLAGEQIPLSARVFAIVDVLDALTSNRPYRPAWTMSEARRHIREQAGRHFDPAVVTAFEALLDSGDA